MNERDLLPTTVIEAGIGTSIGWSNRCATGRSRRVGPRVRALVTSEHDILDGIALSQLAGGA